jgi:hypothetical protein
MFQGDPTANLAITTVTVSGIIVALLQWLKKSTWFTWLTVESQKANRVAAVVLSFFATIGIHVTWNHGALPGSYMLGVTGLTLMGVLLGLWAWIKTFVMQQIIFHATVKGAAGNNGSAAGTVPTATMQMGQAAPKQ